MTDCVNKKENESIEDYLIRLTVNKDEYGITWEDISIIINGLTNKNLNESTYRKKANHIIKMRNLKSIGSKNFVEAKINDEVPEEPDDDMVHKLIELEKKKIQVRDERTQLNSDIRFVSREETLVEMAKEIAESMDNKYLLSVPNITPSGKNAAILAISDWHFGIETNNHLNVYNPEVAKERINKLTAKTIEYGNRHGVKELHVLNLGDLICGRIHLQLRIQSKIDTITQTTMVSELLAEMLTELSKHFIITYHDCWDNHSRIEPNKKESNDLETLARIITEFLSIRLANNKNISIIKENKYGFDIISDEVMGYKIAGVHGDKDKPNKVISNLFSTTGEKFDLVLTSHLHHFSANEEAGTLMIMNGSLMGVDDYASSLRCNSKPTQTLVIVSEESVAEAIYRIVL